MSDTQHYKGTLTKISYDGETGEDAAKRILLTLRGMEKPDYYNTYKEFIECEFYGQAVIINDILYWAIKENIDPYDNFFVGRKTDDPNTIEFDVMYYNGGCSFCEAMEQALKNANQECSKKDVKVTIVKSEFGEPF